MFSITQNLNAVPFDAKLDTTFLWSDGQNLTKFEQMKNLLDREIIRHDTLEGNVRCIHIDLNRRFHTSVGWKISDCRSRLNFACKYPAIGIVISSFCWHDNMELVILLHDFWGRLTAFWKP